MAQHPVESAPGRRNLVCWDWKTRIGDMKDALGCAPIIDWIV
jgi:hypothetical protein